MAAKIMQRLCIRYGLTTFRLEKRTKRRNQWRCIACNKEHSISHRQKVKRALLEEAGGRCKICGYNRSIRALHFHHLDPKTKSFNVSGKTMSLAVAQSEAAKCMLLCANCHAEVEDGLIQI
jgi:5-methylcytosine-specific restriction endonuclease McrA